MTMQSNIIMIYTIKFFLNIIIDIDVDMANIFVQTLN